MPRARLLVGLNERATNIAAITLVALTPLSLLKDVSALAFTSLLGCVAVVNTALALGGDPRALAQHARAHHGARASPQVRRRRVHCVLCGDPSARWLVRPAGRQAAQGSACGAHTRLQARIDVEAQRSGAHAHIEPGARVHRPLQRARLLPVARAPLRGPLWASVLVRMPPLESSPPSNFPACKCSVSRPACTCSPRRPPPSSPLPHRYAFGILTALYLGMMRLGYATFGDVTKSKRHVTKSLFPTGTLRLAT